MAILQCTKTVESQNKETIAIVNKEQAKALFYADLTIFFMLKHARSISNKSLQP
jgi:hypothetical protein